MKRLSPDELAPAKPAVSESTILESVLRYARIHPKVAWIRRMNSGGVKKRGRYITFGFVGCSDLIGQMLDGRFIALECKNATGKPTEEQETFLARVKRHNGVSGIVRSVNDAEEVLNG